MQHLINFKTHKFLKPGIEVNKPKTFLKIYALFDDI